jgi:hypothetical protein
MPCPTKLAGLRCHEEKIARGLGDVAGDEAPIHNVGFDDVLREKVFPILTFFLVCHRVGFFGFLYILGLTS